MERRYLTLSTLYVACSLLFAPCQVHSKPQQNVSNANVRQTDSSRDSGHPQEDSKILNSDPSSLRNKRALNPALNSAFTYNGRILRNILQNQGPKALEHPQSYLFLDMLRPLDRRTARYSDWDGHSVMHFGKRSASEEDGPNGEEGKEEVSEPEDQDLEKKWTEHNVMHFGKRSSQEEETPATSDRENDSWKDGFSQEDVKKSSDEPWHSGMSFGKKSEPVQREDTEQLAKKDEPWHSGMSFGKRDEPWHSGMSFGKKDEPWHSGMSFGKKWEDHNTMHFGKRDEPWHNGMSFGKKDEPWHNGMSFGKKWEDHNTMHFGKRDEPWHNGMSFGKRDEPWHNGMSFGKKDEPWHNGMSFGKKWEDHNTMHFGKRDEPWHNGMSFGKKNEPWHNGMSFGKKDEPWHNAMSFGKKDEPWHNGMSFGKKNEPWHNGMSFGKKNEPWHNGMSFGKKNEPWHNAMSFGKKWDNHNTMHFGKRDEPWHSTMSFGKRDDAWHNTLSFGKRSGNEMENQNDATANNNEDREAVSNIMDILMKTADFIEAKDSEGTSEVAGGIGNGSINKEHVNVVAEKSASNQGADSSSSKNVHKRSLNDQQTVRQVNRAQNLLDSNASHGSSDTHFKKERNGPSSETQTIISALNSKDEAVRHKRSIESVLGGIHGSSSAGLHIEKRSLDEDESGNDISNLENDLEKRAMGAWESHNTMHFGKKSDPWASHNTMHFGKKADPWESHNTMHFGKKSDPWENHNTMHFGKRSDPWESHNTMHFGKKSDPWENHNTMHFGKRVLSLYAPNGLNVLDKNERSTLGESPPLAGIQERENYFLDTATPIESAIYRDSRNIEQVLQFLRELKESGRLDSEAGNQLTEFLKDLMRSDMDGGESSYSVLRSALLYLRMRLQEGNIAQGTDEENIEDILKDLAERLDLLDQPEPVRDNIVQSSMTKRYFAPFQGPKSLVLPHAWFATQIRRSLVPRSRMEKTAEKKDDPVNSFMHFG